MAYKPFIGELTPEDIPDLYNDFNRLKDFIEDLTCILFDNTELPAEITNQIETLYAKKFV